MNKKFTEIYNSIDDNMTSAVPDYKDPFHLFYIATSSEKTPNIRTVVLRSFSMNKNFFEFHSDIRSPKIEQLNINSNFSALFYNPDTKIQLRFSGTTNILHKDESPQKRWI